MPQDTGTERRFVILLPAEGAHGDIGASLGRALKAADVPIGYFAIPSVSPSNVRLIDRNQLYCALRDFGATDLFTINIQRTMLDIPDNITHHVWIQDPHDAGCRTDHKSDYTWMYVAYWVARHQVGEFFPPATEYGQYYNPDHEEHYDAEVSFAGFLPIYSRVKDNPELSAKRAKLLEVIEKRLLETKCYVGDWDMCDSLLFWAEMKTGIYLGGILRNEMVYNITCRVVRRVRREQVMNFLVDLCKRRRWRLKIGGANWSMSKKFKPYAVDHVNAGADLAKFFQRSKVNIQTGGDTNFHGRVLECAASGGFIITERHITDQQPGGIRDILTEEQVPGFGDFDELEEKITYYIEHEKERKEAAKAAGEIVRRDHNYAARVQLLLSRPPVRAHQTSGCITTKK